MGIDSATYNKVCWLVQSEATSVILVKSLKLDASPRLNCDSEYESTSVVETESMFSFSLYGVAWPSSELESLREKYISVCTFYSYEELKLATTCFSLGIVL